MDIYDILDVEESILSGQKLKPKPLPPPVVDIKPKANAVVASNEKLDRTTTFQNKDPETWMVDEHIDFLNSLCGNQKENNPPTSTPPTKLAPVTTTGGKTLTQLKKQIPVSPPPAPPPTSTSTSTLTSTLTSSSSPLPPPLAPTSSSSSITSCPSSSNALHSSSTSSSLPLPQPASSHSSSNTSTSSISRPPLSLPQFCTANSSSSQLQKDRPSVGQSNSSYELRPDGTFVPLRTTQDRVDRPSASVIPPPANPLELYTPKDAIWKTKLKKGAWTQYRNPSNFPQPERRTSAPNFASSASSSVTRPRLKPYSHYSAPFQLPEGVFQPSKSNLEDLLEGIAETEEEDLDSMHDTPAELLVKLKKYQLHGVAWMIEHENGKNAGGLLADDMGLGKTIQSLALILSNRSETPIRKTTLIVAPLALIRQWEAEIKTRCQEGTLSVCVHHGPSRTKDPAKLAQHDIVITTYQLVVAEFPKSAGKESDDDELDAAVLQRAGAIFKVDWYRVILDEGQTIKNRATLTAKACYHLCAEKRWVLSGTPIQNSVDELYSLFRFLRVRRYCEYANFREHFTRPLQQGRDKTVIKRLQVILKSVMLRRTKSTLISGKPILDLPERIVDTNHLDFSQDERAFYDAIASKVKCSFEDIMNSKGSKHAKMLVLLLRLRQTCNHPKLVAGAFMADMEALEPKPGKEKDQDAEELALLMSEMNVGNAKRTCTICLQVMEDSTSLSVTECLTCQMAMQKRKAIEARGFTSSSKINEMMRLLEDIKRKDPSSKTIVFSQFKSMLDIAADHIRKAGYVFCRYEGNMRNPQREESLRRLKEDPKCTIILVSLRAGALGLNLVSAHRVIMLDVWFNPMVEEQAIDRVHRLGQTRPVHVHRLVIRNTVEERILVLQDKKRELAKGALGGGFSNFGKVTLEDFEFLFSKAAEDAEV